MICFVCRIYKQLSNMRINGLRVKRLNPGISQTNGVSNRRFHKPRKTIGSEPTIGRSHRISPPKMKTYGCFSKKKMVWLLVLSILKNDGVRQWEGWHPIYEMENKKCSKPPTSCCIDVLDCPCAFTWEKVIWLNRRRDLNLKHPQT